MKNYFRRLVVAAVVIGVVFVAFAFAQQKPCATALKFGVADQVGNLNYVTAEKTLAASKLITTGKTYRLAIETNKDIPAFPPRTFSVTILQPDQVAGTSLGPNKTTYNDDIHPNRILVCR